ncbi:MAG: aldo/keto reductase [Bacillota bacterium]|nr:aldo/keto reductase [Bacillota bacterium]
MSQQKLWARETTIAGQKVSKIAFGTEHLNLFLPEFSGKILSDAALLHNVFFWDTDNCYGSQPAVAAGLKNLPREKVVVTSKTYADTEQEAYDSVNKILHDLDTPYIDFCLLHGVVEGRLPYKMPALKALIEMKKQGIIKHAGLSTHCANVAWEASDVEGIEVLCVTFNRDGSRIEQGNLDDMVRALDKAHNKRHIGTYVIKTLGRGDLVHDARNALNWIMDYHDCIDVYNIGYSNLRELRQDLTIVNDYYDGLEGIRE